MIVAQKPAQSLAAPNRPLAVAVRVPRQQRDVALPLVVSLGMEMVDVFAQRPPNRITFDGHSSLTDLTLTQRSA